MLRVSKTTFNQLPSDFDALVRFYRPRAIRDEVDYANAQEVIDALTSITKPSKNQREYLHTLSILFSDYERKAHAVDTSDLGPLDMLRHFMVETETNASDLGRLLGDRSLGAKILRGDRDLSKAHILLLAEWFGVSPAAFL